MEYSITDASKFASPLVLRRHALTLAEEAVRLNYIGRSAEADILADHARQICAQSLMRNVGEFTGWAGRGVANGVAAVGGAIGQGLYDFGTGVAGGWNGQYTPLGRGPRVQMQDRPDTAHLPSPDAVAWAQKHGTTLEDFISRCEKWVELNGEDDFVPHLKRAGIPSDVIKYVNRMVN